MEPESIACLSVSTMLVAVKESFFASSFAGPMAHSFPNLLYPVFVRSDAPCTRPPHGCDCLFRCSGKATKCV